MEGEIALRQGVGRHALEVAEQALPEDALLGKTQVADAMAGGPWRVASTNDNSVGNGLVMPCQQERYADPKGTAALFRTFESDPARPKDPGRTVVQAAEASATPAITSATSILLWPCAYSASLRTSLREAMRSPPSSETSSVRASGAIDSSAARNSSSISRATAAALSA